MEEAHNPIGRNGPYHNFRLKRVLILQMGAKRCKIVIFIAVRAWEI
jgi:hypothetical protein